MHDDPSVPEDKPSYVPPESEQEKDTESETMQLRSGAHCEWPLSRRDFVKGASTVLGASLVSPVLSTAFAEVTVPPMPVTKIAVSITVNGEYKQATIDSRTSLLDLLREHFKLTGTKKGCDHGQCGACTVLLNGRRINSCLALAVSHDGAKLTTIEGLAKGDMLDPVQQAFLDHDGFQCGYCTPGQIVSASALIHEAERGAPSFVTPDLRKTGPVNLTNDEIRERMSGNICRCGAYPGILAAVRQAYQLKSSLPPHGPKDGVETFAAL